MNNQEIVNRLYSYDEYELYMDGGALLKEAADMIEKLTERAESAERERDAAVEQLHGYCPACAHYTSNHCDGACAECKHEYYQYRSPEAKDKWEWNCGDKEE